MGLEPEQFEGGDGVHCPACWSGGKPWEGQGIPAVVTATFGGIIACPDWCDAPNGVFTLAQDPVNTCLWWTEIPNWCQGLTLSISWVLAEVTSALQAYLSPPGDFYFRNVREPCQMHFINDRLVCVPSKTGGIEGIGIIT